MAKSLQEYADWLDGRDLLWPRPPEVQRPKATPSLEPLPGIKVVTWDCYGTLLRITDGRLLFDVDQRLRMQVALEKTIEEFNMWNSMFRTPEAPWEYTYRQYQKAVEDQRLAGSGRKGDFPEIDSGGTWRKLLEQLRQKDYEYDESFYGDLDDLAVKVAYFFQTRLQGVEAAEHAVEALEQVAQQGVRQGLLADGQPFTLVQLQRALRQQAGRDDLPPLVAPQCTVLSCEVHCRKPSRSLYETFLERMREQNVEPKEILHVGSRLKEDLVVARKFGLRTALYAGDKLGLEADRELLKDKRSKPDRLLTDLAQVGRLLGDSPGG